MGFTVHLPFFAPDVNDGRNTLSILRLWDNGFYGTFALFIRPKKSPQTQGSPGVI